MKVEVEVTVTTLEGAHGKVDGVDVSCTRCDHSVQVFGTATASIKRGCVMLREECPNNEQNFYEAP